MGNRRGTRGKDRKGEAGGGWATWKGQSEGARTESKEGGEQGEGW